MAALLTILTAVVLLIAVLAGPAAAGAVPVSGLLALTLIASCFAYMIILALHWALRAAR